MAIRLLRNIAGNSEGVDAMNIFAGLVNRKAQGNERFVHSYKHRITIDMFVIECIL